LGHLVGGEKKRTPTVFVKKGTSKPHNLSIAGQRMRTAREKNRVIKSRRHRAKKGSKQYATGSCQIEVTENGRPGRKTVLVRQKKGVREGKGLNGDQKSED